MKTIVAVLAVFLSITTARADPLIQVLGDSLALGAGWKVCDIMHGLPFRCRINAIERIPSSKIVPMLDKTADVVIISVCANDYDPKVCSRNITTIRQGAKPGAVFVWIVPPKPAWASDMIRQAASGFIDKQVELEPGPDGVHPVSYEKVGLDLVRELLN